MDGLLTPSISATVTRTDTNTDALSLISSMPSNAAPLTTASDVALVARNRPLRLSTLLLAFSMPRSGPLVPLTNRFTLVDGVRRVAEHVDHGLGGGIDKTLVAGLPGVRIPVLHNQCGHTPCQRGNRQ